MKEEIIQLEETQESIITDQLINRVLSVCEENDWHVAIWRLPYHEEVSLLIDSGKPVSFDTLDFNTNQPGFVIAPFNQEEKSKRLLLKGDILFDAGRNDFVSIGNKIQVEDFKHQLNKSAPYKPSQSNLAVPDTNNSTEKSEYLNLVERSVEQISWGKFEKVVPSKIKKVNVQNLDLGKVYLDLVKKYPRAFAYLTFGSKTGTWMGATPEILLEIEDNSLFRTVSLAGTQPYIEGVNLGNVAWRQKEIEEQALVSRYIINCFKKIRLREFEEKGPKTAIAGNLMHLKTTFEVDMIDTGFSNLGSVMLDLLHPTSAVCGMPKKESMEFLLKEESHNRKYYSGFIGPVAQNLDSHIYVNLRCMDILPDHINLYAGAGVTAYSSPENEWEETELKCDTLLSVLTEYL